MQCRTCWARKAEPSTSRPAPGDMLESGAKSKKQRRSAVLGCRVGTPWAGVRQHRLALVVVRLPGWRLQSEEDYSC